MGIIEAKDIFSSFFTDSEMLFKGSCWLYFLSINSSSAGVGIVEIYDGSDSHGSKEFELVCPANNFKQFKLSFPISMRYGLYVRAVQNLRSGFIQLLPACP